MRKVLTIGITTYEETVFLLELLTNISAQFDLDNLAEKCEVIVANDGGQNEETLKIIDSFSNKFKIIISTKNSKSPSDCRNTIINKASAEYVLFMDGDDNFVNSIKDLCNELEQCGTKDIIVSRVKKIKDDGSISEASFIYTNELFDMSAEQFELEHHKVVIHQTGIWSIYNVDFLRKNNITFDSRIRYEDNVFMSKIALTEGVRYGRVYTSYYGWRVNLSSFSHVDNVNIIKYRVELLKRVIALIEANPENKFAPYLLYSVWNQTYGNILRKYPSSFTNKEFREFLEELNFVAKENELIIKTMLLKTDGYTQFPYNLKSFTKSYIESYPWMFCKMQVNIIKRLFKKVM